MTLRLVYSRQHVCHNAEMIWQPAGHRWYCQTCKRVEGPSEYGKPFDEQPEPADTTEAS